MSQWIDKIEYFTSGSDDEANIISVEINHPQADKDGREKAKLLDNSEIFSPFNEKTKTYDRFLTMTVSEDFLLEAGLELFGRLNSKDKFDLVIFFDKELKGFLPIPLPQLAAFIGQHLQEDQENNEQKFKQPDRKELNRFYKLQSKETEDISNPDLQTALDEGNISNDNINQLIDKAVFLVPTKIQHRRLREDRLSFFLLSQSQAPQERFLPVFTDWNHLGQWYFSESANGYNNEGEANIMGVPASNLVGIKEDLGDMVTNVVINPTTNDFLLGLAGNSDKKA